MSHYTTLATQISDVETLVEALSDMGFEEVEVHQEAQPLIGYRGDARAQRAEVIVRRRWVGRASNDIGFARRADGTFEAIISEFDRQGYDQDWLGQLTQRYAYRTARKVLAGQGYELVEESQDDQRRIHVTVRRVA